MMKAIITVSVLLFVALFVGGFSVSFYPFEVRLEHWERTVGFILLFFSMMLFGYSEYMDGYRKGYNKAYEHINGVLEDYKKELEDKDKDADV